MKPNDQWALAGNGTKRILIGLVLAGGVMLTQPLMAAGPAPVDLRSCYPFAILAASTVSTTGGGIINGDVGLSPAGSQQIPPAQINGTIYNGGPIAAQAQLDLTAAYNDAAGRSVNKIMLTDGENIGGLTLVPGLYWSATSLQITGDLTLNGGPDDVWIFQIGSTLTTAAGAADAPHSRVILAGGAQAKNIFWQVGSSATLGTYSVFKGTIMSQASITMGNYSIMEGRALARTGAVTFNGSGGSLPTSTIIVKANGATGNVTVNYPETVSITVSMNAGADAGLNTDWWVVALANGSWYYLHSGMQWKPFDGNPSNCHPVHQGALFDLPATQVLNMTLPIGSYTFWFAVDQEDGILNVDGPILVDSVNVTVQ